MESKECVTKGTPEKEDNVGVTTKGKHGHEGGSRWKGKLWGGAGKGRTGQRETKEWAEKGAVTGAGKRKGRKGQGRVGSREEVGQRPGLASPSLYLDEAELPPVESPGDGREGRDGQ